MLRSCYVVQEKIPEGKGKEKGEEEETLLTEMVE